MSMLFFNIMFIFFYYFKIVSFMYTDLWGLSSLGGVILVNFLVLFFDLVYIYAYSLLGLYHLSYLKIFLLGLIMGTTLSILFLGWGKYVFGDHLAIISYVIINTIFISYSLYFDENKIKVFG